MNDEEVARQLATLNANVSSMGKTLDNMSQKMDNYMERVVSLEAKVTANTEDIKNYEANANNDIETRIELSKLTYVKLGTIIAVISVFIGVLLHFI